MKTKEFVTLAKFASLEEAQVISALLDSMGVNNEIMNETAAQIMPYLEGDVRIMVNASDFDRAKELLNAKFDKKEILYWPK